MYPEQNYKVNIYYFNLHNGESLKQLACVNIRFYQK